MLVLSALELQEIGASIEQVISHIFSALTDPLLLRSLTNSWSGVTCWAPSRISQVHGDQCSCCESLSILGYIRVRAPAVSNLFSVEEFAAVFFGCSPPRFSNGRTCRYTRTPAPAVNSLSKSLLFILNWAHLQRPYDPFGHETILLLCISIRMYCGVWYIEYSGIVAILFLGIVTDIYVFPQVIIAAPAVSLSKSLFT